MKIVLGTFDDLMSARTCEQELRAAGYTRVELAHGTHDLATMGLPREAIDRHRIDLDRGGALVIVRCDDKDEPEVRDILERGYVAGRAEGSLGSDRDGESIRVPIVEEEVAVGKAVQKRGGVRLHTYAEERPVETTVNLREERVDVERHKVDRPLQAGDENLFRDRTIEVDEIREVPVVDKEVRVVEEVVVTKDVEVHPTTVRETVRKTQVDIDEDITPLGNDRASQFGYELADDSRYGSSDWSSVESDARTRWGHSNDPSTWDKMKASIRNAFESRRADRRRPHP